MFVSFDGIDGAGKSTQIDLFVKWVESLGLETTVCRDPGSTKLGETLRRVVLDESNEAICDRSEMLIYMAARAQLVEEIIRPALAEGRIVVSDRYLLANIAYQGHGAGRDVDDIRTVGNIATNGLMPDLVFLLDLPARTALERINRPLDRMESKGESFLSRVRQGFLEEAKTAPQSIFVINATKTADQMHAEVISHAKSRLDQQANSGWSRSE